VHTQTHRNTDTDTQTQGPSLNLFMPLKNSANARVALQLQEIVLPFQDAPYDPCVLLELIYYLTQRQDVHRCEYSCHTITNHYARVSNRCNESLSLFIAIPLSQYFEFRCIRDRWTGTSIGLGCPGNQAESLIVAGA
jgi:hypothetical protein